MSVYRRFEMASIAFILLELLTLVRADDGATIRRDLQVSGGKRRYPPTPLVLAVFGDWPYTQTALDKDANALIASINNATDVQVVVHVGDIKSGGLPCSGAGAVAPYTVTETSDPLVLAKLTGRVINPYWNTAVYNVFAKIVKPFIYTPGDNEWTDCYSDDAYNSGAPLEELRGLRNLFFSAPGQTIGGQKTVISQATAYDPNNPIDQQFVENVRWTDQTVVFATFNMPGGSNDDSVSQFPWAAPYDNEAAQKKEQYNRDGANLRWLKATFQAASDQRAEAIVLFMQADMWGTWALPSYLTNFKPFVTTLANLALSFDKPVLLINGDTHIFAMDQPLMPTPNSVKPYKNCNPYGPPGKRCDLYSIHDTVKVPNFSRMTVEGGPLNYEWIKLRIDTSTSAVFSYTRVTFASE